MCKLVSWIKRGLSLFLEWQHPKEEGYLFIAVGRFCRVANLETHFAIFASLRIIKFRLVLPIHRGTGTNRDAEDMFGRRPGLLFRIGSPILRAP